MSEAPQQRYVGYPRRRVSENAERIQALGYAEVAFSALLVVSAAPMVMFSPTATRIPPPVHVGDLVYLVAMAVGICKSYRLLVKGGASTRFYAALAGIAYVIVFFLSLMLTTYAGELIFVFGGGGVILPGRWTARAELEKHGLGNGVIPWRQFKRVVEERRLDAPFEFSSPTDPFSGDGPKTMA